MANSQIQKMETNVHIKACAEQVYDVFCNRTNEIPKIFPEKVQAVEIHEGQWGTEGSIISGKYLHEGKTCVDKVLVEGIDTANNKVTFKFIEGTMLGVYKSFKLTMQVTPKEKEGLVHLVLEYEKQNDHIPDPRTLLQSLIEPVVQKVDAYLTKGQN